jgi:hypothetical protein
MRLETISLGERWKALAGLRIPAVLFLTGVWYAVTLHVIWATLLFTGDDAKHATAVYTLARLFPAKTGLAIVLLFVAIMASYGLLKRTGPPGGRIMLLVPQQLVLGISAAGCVRAMWLGHFADGVTRPTAFLIADQAPAILALMAHSATIFYIALVRRWE